MRAKFLLLGLVSTPLVAQVSPVAFSESRDVVPAFSSSGSITLPVVRLHLDITYSHGKKERCDLTVVYDPQDGYYFWRYAKLSTLSNTGGYIRSIKSHGSAVYADTTGLYVFEFPSGFWMKIYTSRANSLDAAESASVSEIQQGLADFEGGFHRDYKPLDLRKAITRDFNCLPAHPNCQEELNTIVSVSRQGSNWRLILRNRWDEEVILDQNFNLVSAQQLTQPKQ